MKTKINLIINFISGEDALEDYDNFVVLETPGQNNYYSVNQIKDTSIPITEPEKTFD